MNESIKDNLEIVKLRAELARLRRPSRKEKLEIEKLEAEIEQLRRPDHRDATFWISVASAVIAVLGVVGQGILSQIKVERARTEVESARLEAKKEIDAAQEARKKAVEYAREASAAREEHSRLVQLLDDLRVQTASLEPSGERARIQVKVNDALTTRPIAGVRGEAYVQGQLAARFVTDGNGSFDLILPKGDETFRLVVRKDGFLPASSVREVLPNEDRTVEVALTPKAD